MLIFVYLLDDLILGFCYSNLTQDTGGLELSSTITLILRRTDYPIMPYSQTKRSIVILRKNKWQCRQEGSTSISSIRA